MAGRGDDVAGLVELTQAELEQALRATPMAMWDADYVAERTWTSPNQASLFGLDAESGHWTPERFFDFVHPDDRARVAAELQAQVGELFELECRIITGKGETRWIHTIGRRIVDGEGKVLRAYGATADVTARKVAQTALASSVTRLRFLADLGEALAQQTSFADTLAAFAHRVAASFCDGCMIDFAVGPTQRRSAWAHRVPEKDALLGEISRQHPPATGEMNPVMAAMKSGTTQRFLEPDADWIRAIVAARGPAYGEKLARLGIRSALIVPVVLDEEMHGGVTFVLTEGERRFDDADQRTAEEIVRRGAVAFERALLHGRTQDALRARDSLISTSSHELLTPITTMKLLVDSMKRNLDAELDRNKVARMLDVTDRAMRRLQRLVDDMLDVSRASAGKLSVHARPMDLSAAVAETIERLRDTLDRHLTKVELQLTHPLLGAWDHDRIDQIVTNLLTNVVRYAPQSTLTITTRLVDGMAEIAVSDTGPGIALADQERIFHKFERALLPGDGSGLGLGLFIVKQIVERHRGHIWVESELGAGARFVVRLPLS